MLINLLAETTENTDGFGYIPVIIIIAVLLIAVMVVFPMISNKRRKKQVEDQLNSLAIGDTVETVGGVIGKLISVRTVGSRKEMIIETGIGDSATTFVVDLQALYAVLEKSGGAPALPNYSATATSNTTTAKAEIKENTIAPNSDKVADEQTVDKSTEVFDIDGNSDDKSNENEKADSVEAKELNSDNGEKATK